ncbi:sigma-70 family RNA polymerase sigma factor [Paenibacillus sp. sgz302251]|uniref:sigma-70 family RNA polymerase sigma factor n=1 Tax=Paenibacillus sp. sgz302251 TaxID=3414493 RepID=UPI003C7E7387
MTFPKEKEQMVLDNMGLVIKMANKMILRANKNTIVDFDDLVQVGSIGLMSAVQRYDDSKGYSFSTFACSTINFYMMSELNRKADISASVRVIELSRFIRMRGQQEMELEELAKIYKCPVKKIESALEFLKIRTKSADRTVRDEENEDNIYNIIGLGDDHDGRLIIDDFISRLKPSYQTMMRGVLDGKTLVEIAQERGKSRQNIHRMRVEVQLKWLDYVEGRELRGRKFS